MRRARTRHDILPAAALLAAALWTAGCGGPAPWAAPGQDTGVGIEARTNMPNVQPIAPFLMFEGRAEEAMNFYVSLFPESRVESISRYGEEGPGAAGSVEVAEFTLHGLRVMCIDSPMPHGFTFTPATSLFVRCETREEVDRLFQALSEDGQVLMPLDEYPFSRRFAWVNDRFGVSWQLSLGNPAGS